jgi:hypothetical protein
MSTGCNWALHRHQGHRGEVDASLAEGRALHVDATPTLFLNGRRLVGNYPWQNIDQIINGELNYQKTAQNTPPKSKAEKSDDKCCEVKIPSRSTSNMRLPRFALDRAWALIALEAGLFAANISSDEYLGIVKFLASPECAAAPPDRRSSKKPRPIFAISSAA